MHVKKLMEVSAVVAVMVLGTAAGAEQAAPPAPQAKAPAAPQETITLKSGEVRTLEVKDVTRVAVGDPKIADISVAGEQKTQLRITGGEHGRTTLLVWTKDGARKEYLLVIRD